MANYFSYLRISTKEERAKQKYTRQENAIHNYAKRNNLEILLEFKDDASGKNFSERPEWGRLEKIVRPGDTIIFKDISRFSREVEGGYEKYLDLMTNGVNLIFIDNPTLSTDYIKDLLKIAQDQDIIARESTRFIAKILLIAELDRAEKERLAISMRTRDGMAASPNKAGRKPGNLDKMTPALAKDINEYLNDRSIKQVDLMRRHGISRNTLKKYIAHVSRPKENN